MTTLGVPGVDVSVGGRVPSSLHWVSPFHVGSCGEGSFAKIITVQLTLIYKFLMRHTCRAFGMGTVIGPIGVEL